MNDSSKVVIIKHYNNSSEAYMDRGLLQANGIESEVGNSTMGTLLPVIEMITLMVAAEDVPRALKIVPGSSIEREY